MLYLHLCLCCTESLAWRAKVSADTALEHPLEPGLMQLVRQCRPSSYIGFDSQVRGRGRGYCSRVRGQRVQMGGLAVLIWATSWV